ncbi:MAG: exosortase/archaeosortase family protein [Verrucomicrobiia bacterium]
MDEKQPSATTLDFRDSQTWLHCLLGLMAAALVWFLYFANDSWWAEYVGYLRGPDFMYSHAPLIPAVSLWLLWRQRHELLAAPRRTAEWAAGLVVLALLMYWVGHKTSLWRLTMVSLILLIWAAPLYLWGWEVGRRLMFPMGFLLFAVPLNFVTDLTNPLKRLVSAISTLLLNMGGVHVERSGAQIFSVPHGRFQLEVADACSGINSLIALVTLATIYGYVTRQRQWQRWVLVASAVPLAMFGNLVRVTSSAVVGNLMGQEAIGVFDKFSTFLVFIPAIALMLAVDRLLDMNWQEWKARWLGSRGT